jgi:hypothetical protein
MSKRLELIRGIRDEVVRRHDVSEGCGEEEHLAKKPRRRALRKRAKEESRQDFGEWMNEVSAHIDEITGMDMEDILGDVPWDEFYRKGMTATDAAETALQQAEDEEDTFDVPDYLGEEDEVPTLRRRRDIGGSDVLSSIHEINEFFFDVDRQVESEEEYDEDSYDEDDDCLEEEVVAPAPAPKQRPRPKPVFTAESPYPKPPTQVAQEQAMSMDVSAGMFGDPNASGAPSPLGEEAALISDLTAHMAPMIANEKRAKEAAVAEAKLADQRAREATESGAGGQEDVSSDESVEEGVVGGDYGRWKPAHSAVSSSGGGLASKLSKKYDTKYTIDSDGTPASGEGGSELWYNVEPKDSGKPIHYLCVKIKQKDKNSDPKWDVLLKKGPGIASSTGVASKRGVSSSEIAGAISGLSVGSEG